MVEYDKITPLAAPAGHSLTQEPGKWPWENPPRFADPDDAIDFLTDKLDDPKTKEPILKLFLAGISVEEIVNQIAFKGFMTGTYSPDVAELVKPALAMFLIDEAAKVGIQADLFHEKKEDEDISDAGLFEIMKNRNPELYLGMIEAEKKQDRMQISEAKNLKPNLSNSFLQVEEVE